MPNSEILKIKVLSSGVVLLNGEPVTLLDLEAVFTEAREDETPVLFEREHPEAALSPEAEAVLKLIRAHRLRISLGGSDQSSAEAPKVVELPVMDNLFAKLRRQSAQIRGISLLRPDRSSFVLAAPAPGTIPEMMTSAVTALVPPGKSRNIAAIAAPGSLVGDPAAPPTLADVARQVPFFGLLVALAYTGNVAWIFDASLATGSAGIISAGCRDADVLMLDSDALPALPRGWQESAGAAMRNANILVFDRSRQKLGALRTAGEVGGQLEFPN